MESLTLPVLLLLFFGVYFASAENPLIVRPSPQDIRDFTNQDDLSSYMEWIPKLGSEAIQRALHNKYPSVHDHTCHFLVHGLKDAYKLYPDLTFEEGYSTCLGLCFGGCLHAMSLGYLGNILNKGWSLSQVATEIEKICFNEKLSEFEQMDCIHAAGHPLHTKYGKSQTAFDHCNSLSKVEYQHLCQEGIFMSFYLQFQNRGSDSLGVGNPQGFKPSDTSSCKGEIREVSYKACYWEGIMGWKGDTAYENQTIASTMGKMWGKACLSKTNKEERYACFNGMGHTLPFPETGRLQVGRWVCDDDDYSPVERAYCIDGFFIGYQFFRAHKYNCGFIGDPLWKDICNERNKLPFYMNMRDLDYETILANVADQPQGQRRGANIGGVALNFLQQMLGSGGNMQFKK